MPECVAGGRTGGRSGCRKKPPNGLKNARIPENGDVYMKTFSDLCSRIRFVRASFGRRSAAAPSGMPGTVTDDRDRFRTIRHETTAVFSVGGPSVPPHCGPESRNATSAGIPLQIPDMFPIFAVTY